MAFNTKPAASNNGGIPDNKKAKGFINFWLPNESGGRKKLGAIPLRAMYGNEATLADWLAEDPAARCARILSIMQIDYQAVDVEGNGFALPADVPATPAKGAKSKP